MVKAKKKNKANKEGDEKDKEEEEKKDGDDVVAGSADITNTADPLSWADDANAEDEWAFTSKKSKKKGKKVGPETLKAYSMMLTDPFRTPKRYRRYRRLPRTLLLLPFRPSVLMTKVQY
jgi:hypothetical protein